MSVTDDGPQSDDLAICGRGQRDVLNLVAGGRVPSPSYLRGDVVQRFRAARRQRFHGTSVEPRGGGSLPAARRPTPASPTGLTDDGGHDVAMLRVKASATHLLFVDEKDLRGGKESLRRKRRKERAHTCALSL